MSNNKRNYALEISDAEILESAQFNFELKIKHALRHTSHTKGAVTMRSNMVKRYEVFMQDHGLTYNDLTIPGLLAEWIEAMSEQAAKRAKTGK